MCHLFYSFRYTVERESGKKRREKEKGEKREEEVTAKRTRSQSELQQRG